MSVEKIEDIYPLSPLQQAVLFYSLYSAESAMYHVQVCYTLQGNLNSKLFEQSWQEVIRRHSILRTAFFVEDLDEPVQVVKREAIIPLVQDDWRTLTAAQQEERLEVYLSSDRHPGFDLAAPP